MAAQGRRGRNWPWGPGGGGMARRDSGSPMPPKPVRIDFDKLQQRIVALPLPARGYTSLRRGAPG